jgi:hypothetical protein
MNIQNLNQQELKQLQLLLNKMNPVIEINPVDKMIDGIMEEFNFDRVQSTMEYLNWKWIGEHVTMEMLRNEAERLLRGAAEMRLGEYKNEPYYEPIQYSTGGFEATAWCNELKTKITALELKFVLAGWDKEIED